MAQNNCPLAAFDPDSLLSALKEIELKQAQGQAQGWDDLRSRDKEIAAQHRRWVQRTVADLIEGEDFDGVLTLLHELRQRKQGRRPSPKVNGAKLQALCQKAGMSAADLAKAVRRIPGYRS